MYIQKMTEKGENDNYIKCSRCTCKYINDDEHIKKDFGYNRLNERFKTCSKCRDKKNAYTQETSKINIMVIGLKLFFKLKELVNYVDPKK